MRQNESKLPSVAMAWLLLICAGCNVVGAVAYKVVGPPDVPAKYVPQRTPIVVIAETYRDLSSTAIQAEQLARYVADELVMHDVAPVVDPSLVLDLQAKDRQKFRRMSITEIGREVGAAQVLYINILKSDSRTAQGTDILRGEVSARVKLVDVASGVTLWPEDSAEGYPVAGKTPYVRSGDGVDEVSVNQSLQQALAEQIGKLFYKWKPDSEVRE